MFDFLLQEGTHFSYPLFKKSVRLLNDIGTNQGQERGSIWREKCVLVAESSLYLRTGIKSPVLNVAIKLPFPLTVERAEGVSVARCANATHGSTAGVPLAERIINALMRTAPHGKDVFAWEKTI